jgi:hypothetical protein
VSALKPSGERLTMTMRFADMLEEAQVRAGSAGAGAGAGR